MAFLFQGRKPAKTMWIQGPLVDWAQVQDFVAPAPAGYSQPPTRRPEAFPPAMLIKQQGSTSSFQASVAARPRAEMPVMDAREAALRYCGYYVCTKKKRT